MKLGRLVVLVVALGAGGLAAILAGKSRAPTPVVSQAPVPETVDVLVARSDVQAGRVLQPGDLEWKPWPVHYAPDSFIKRNQHPNATEQMVGYVAKSAIFALEPIREAKLMKGNGAGYMAGLLPVGMRAVSTEITPEAGAGGFILPNDRVDVILTRAEKDERGRESYRSQTVLADVRVLAIDQNADGKTDKRTAIGKIATLELSPSDAERLALARRLGTLSLTLRGLAETALGKPAGEEPTLLEAKKTVTIVRFGVASTN